MSPADHTPHYLDELKPGLVMCSDPLGELLNMEDIKTFARQFDPQPFHLDEVAAEKTLFGGLSASGWHTAAVTMRLLVDGGLPLAGGIIGAGVEEIRWPRPVRPGDRLHIVSEVLGHGRRARSRNRASPRSGSRR